MDNHRAEGRKAGIFLLIMVLAGIPGVLFRDVGSSMLEDPDLLNSLLDKSQGMRLSIFLSLAAGVSGLLFSVTVYRAVSSYSKFVAITFLSLWITQMAIASVGDVFVYMLSESAQYANETGATDGFLSMAALAVKGYIGAHFLSLILFSGSFVFLHANLMRFGLLPKWLTIWGMLAPGAVFFATWMQIFDQSVSFHFYNQNGLFMLSFTTYMLIKGFSEGTRNS